MWYFTDIKIATDLLEYPNSNKEFLITAAI
jgi:hypothetical protein